ncbi:hypothetical protein CRE_09891 [Caenorhabditis remanei]|uniref:Uncharacterized protein n=1 Tax=Caenorhabditis remanei TaxID=31234 RepID=E3NMA7_CAERE|nr:hypothetical protein CRE_09891 [Caenorhabditis remanei]
MKFLAIAFLLVQSVHGMTRAECADGVNNARAEEAKQNQWANVHKLLYNNSLEKPLEEFLIQYKKTCPRSAHISGDYVVNLYIMDYHDQKDGGLEFLRRGGSYGIPQSDMMACASTTCLENGKPVFGVITNKVRYPSIPPPQGPPGSKCYLSGRLANSEGLCVLKSDKTKFVRKGVLQQVGDAMDHTFGWG